MTSNSAFCPSEKNKKQVRLVEATIRGKSRESWGWEEAEMEGGSSVIAVTKSCEMKDSALRWARKFLFGCRIAGK